MCGLPGFLANGSVGDYWKAVVGTPNITETATSKILIRQLAPEPFAGFHRAIADEEGENLPGLSALCNPDTNLLSFLFDKRKNLVHFNHGHFFYSSE